jgi:hypothetical protein
MTLSVLTIFGAGLCALLLATALAEADGRTRLLERLDRDEDVPASRRAATDHVAGPADA